MTLVSSVMPARGVHRAWGTRKAWTNQSRRPRKESDPESGRGQGSPGHPELLMKDEGWEACGGRGEAGFPLTWASPGWVTHVYHESGLAHNDPPVGGLETRSGPPGPAPAEGAAGPLHQTARGPQRVGSEAGNTAELGGRQRPCGLSDPPCTRTTQASLGAHLRQGRAPPPGGQGSVSRLPGPAVQPRGPGR